MNLTETLKLLAAEPDADLDIAEVALLIAADEYPDLDVPIYLARLDSLAEELAPRLAGSLADRVTELSALLFEEHGLAGNGGEYYDPRNSYLCDVLDRKLGIPITLSVVALAVGQRAGLDVNGVALPGHFVAMASEGGGVVLFDPFNGGQLLTVGACETLVSAVVGSPFRVTPEVLRPAPPGAVALRILSNLKAIYLQSDDFLRAARVIERVRLLTPWDVTQRRDLGVSLVHADQPGRAIDHLAAYLREQPEADDREQVSAILGRARASVSRWN